MNNVKGCLIGALVGDAAGAVLEFCWGKLTDERVLRAMRMPGGGALCVGAGQITDDGELTLALASSLEDKFDIEKIMKSYISWYKSSPFDCGNTCRLAFGGKVESSEDMMDISHINNIRSEANGALMRLTPIPTFYNKWDFGTIAQYAKADAALSHPSPVCQDCNAIYAISIAYLIKHPGDYLGAVELVESWPILAIVKSWMEESKTLNIEDYDCSNNIGHVKHAFILCMYFLRNKTPFVEAIHLTLKKGGDTDTNAAIVGGMMGALWGFDAIPEYMIKPVMDFDCENCTKGHKRPGHYKASNILNFINKITIN